MRLGHDIEQMSALTFRTKDVRTKDVVSYKQLSFPESHILSQSVDSNLDRLIESDRKCRLREMGQLSEVEMPNISFTVSN